MFEKKAGKFNKKWLFNNYNNIYSKLFFFNLLNKYIYGLTVIKVFYNNH